MFVYLLSGVISFPLIAFALWGRGSVLALVCASFGASVIAGGAALVMNLRRTRRQRRAARTMREARATLAE